MINTADSCPEVTAIVPAAGIGSRMQSVQPKQYLTIGNQTILEHSITSLLAHPAVTRVIVALNPDDQSFRHLPLACDPRITSVTGGKQRAESVLAGLQVVSGTEWVLVHDAARPCLHQSDLARLLQYCGRSQSGAILAAPVRDTMKRSQPDQETIMHTVERNDLWHALTPQLFPLMLLRDCLTRALNEGATITDEASALEYGGYAPLLVPGRSDNIKVTRPEDLALAAFYLTQLHEKGRT